MSALLIGSELNVFSDRADSITVRANPSGQVEVLDQNGLLASAPVVSASTLMGLVITGSDGDNIIDLFGVSAVQFTTLSKIVVNAGGGNDLLNGPLDVSSTLIGGDGDDILLGSDANDLLEGGDGDDTIGGFQGNDTIRGGNGADTIFGFEGSDSIFGDDGKDLIGGDEGDDWISGGNGNDSVLAGDGTDTVNGESGNDVILGESGNDSLISGAGDDLVDAGDGNDAVVGNAGEDTLDGGDGNDVIDGNDGRDFLSGGNGEDLVNGGSGNDLILAGGGNDTAFGGSGVDTSFGGEGNDSLLGQAGDDVLIGNEGLDSLIGGAGDDFIQTDGPTSGGSVISISSSSTVTASISSVTISEGSPTAIVTVSLSGPAFEPISIAFGTQNGTATAGSDFLATSGTLTFIPGAISLDIVIPIVNDTTIEPMETFSVILGQTTGPVTVPNPSAQFTIIDDDVAPPPPPQGLTLSIDDVMIPEGDSGRTDVVFTVTLSAVSTQTVSANFALQDETATNPEDYTGSGGFSRFADPVQVGSPGTPVGIPPREVEVADVNLDGIDDILTYPASSPTAAGLLLGVASPGVPLAASANGFSISTLSSNVTAFRVTDLNSDGSADVFIRQFLSPGVLGTPGSSTGIFGAPVRIQSSLGGATSLGGSLAFGDFNNDTFMDFVSGAVVPVGQAADDTGLQVFLNTGGMGPLAQTTFTPTQRIDLGAAISDGSFAVALEMNGDSNDDFLFIGNSSIPFDNTARLYLSNGDGTFQSALSLGAFGGNVDPQVADLNGDGFDDLVTLNQGAGQLEVRLRDPSRLGFFSPMTFASGGTPIRLVLRDLDQDGNIDAVALNQNTKSVSVFIGTGSGTFANAVNFSTGSLSNRRLNPSDLAIGDVNGDGILDAVVGNNNNGNFVASSVSILYGVGGNSTGGTVTFAPGETTKQIHVSIVGDKIVEPDENLSVSLSAAVNATISDGIGIGTILNDDTLADDYVEGGDGNDTLIGGAAPDLLNGQGGNDLISGGIGDDTLLGGSGNDNLNGDDGNDSLVGQSGNDLVEGGVGDDHFVWTGAGDGKDTMSNSSGFDSVVVSGNGAGNSFVVGQSPSNQLTVTESGTTLVVQSNIVNVVINGNGGNDAITIGSVHQVAGVLLTVNGGEGHDSLSAAGALLGTVRLRLSGDSGNDTLTGSADRDTLDGGDGNDVLSGGTGNDSLLGGLGHDVLNGNDGNDSLLGGDGNDALRGNAGNDSITGGLGNDSVLGGDGNDTATGDEGNDSLTGDAGNDSLNGGSGADTLTGSDGADTLDGGMNGDSLLGSAGDDLLRGGEGDDTLDGGDGHDSLIGGDGADVLNGGNGNDAINAGQGHDIVNGGAGNDSLLGSDGNDTLRGGSGNDVLLGGDGDDNLDGQGGADTLGGNQGADTLSNTLGDLINEAFALPAALLAALE